MIDPENIPKDFKSGFVAIVGRPNVGKSTILNSLIGSKISIISPIPQTTRHQIKGILNFPQAQVVFVDTPGIHSFKDDLAGHLNVIAEKSLEGCDLILYVVDISRPVGREETTIVNLLIKQRIPIIMVFNKLDLGGDNINDYLAFWQEKLKEKKYKDPVVSYLPLSALKNKNIDTLKKIILENLPQGMPYYDDQTVTDFPLRYRVADCVREKLFMHLKKELPHSLAVEVEEMTEREDKKNLMYIKVNIYVNRDSQKKIVIGKQGAILKEIGKEARLDIEKFLNKRVYLEMWVKVLEDWQKRPRILQEIGYWA